MVESKKVIRIKGMDRQSLRSPILRNIGDTGVDIILCSVHNNFVTYVKTFNFVVIFLKPHVRMCLYLCFISIPSWFGGNIESLSM